MNKSYMTRRLPKPYSQPIFNLTVKNWRIPMRDGIKIYAKAWHPVGEGPFPVVINYDPYRSSDFRTMARGNYFHFLARHGYVFIHLGVLGTDGSEGSVTDEYPLQEQEDGYDAVEWVAKQPWCNGKVGMMGTSYAGFTAIQVAMHRPPHLKAIIPLYATDDRYTDDVHYTGGALDSIFDLAGWATMMVSMNALPPPEYIGEDYNKIWEEHLEGNVPYQLNWLENQTDGSYWRPASLRPNYDLIECPVFIVGAWHDHYRNSALRMFEHLEVPKKLLMGPWGHVFPDWGYPGEPINFMPQVVRWFDHWLKDIDTGIMKEPSFMTFMMNADNKQEKSKGISGYWRNERKWPLEKISSETLYLGAQKKLLKKIRGVGKDSYPYCASVGMGNPTWERHIADGGKIARNLDEEKSIHYLSEAYDEKVEILGRPQLNVKFTSTAPVVNIIVKLFDIAPDDSSYLFSWGTLNVTHRESHSEPKQLEPGEEVDLKIELEATAWIIRPGHKLKLSIMGSDYPFIWPSPYPAANTVIWGEETGSCLRIPIVKPGNPDKAPIFGDIEMPMDVYEWKSEPMKSRVDYNIQEEETTFSFSGKHVGELSEDGVSMIYIAIPPLND